MFEVILFDGRPISSPVNYVSAVLLASANQYAGTCCLLRHAPKTPAKTFSLPDFVETCGTLDKPPVPRNQHHYMNEIFRN